MRNICINIENIDYSEHDSTDMIRVSDALTYWIVSYQHRTGTMQASARLIEAALKSVRQA